MQVAGETHPAQFPRRKLEEAGAHGQLSVRPGQRQLAVDHALGLGRNIIEQSQQLFQSRPGDAQLERRGGPPRIDLQFLQYFVCPKHNCTRCNFTLFLIFIS